MRKYMIFLFLFCIGCSRQTNLTCTYIDQTSIYGVKKITDNLTFKNDKLISYERIINFKIDERFINSSNDIYKFIKKESKTIKKYINGKYKISRSNSYINSIISIKKFNNNDLSYLKIDMDNIKESYESLSFICSDEKKD